MVPIFFDIFNSNHEINPINVDSPKIYIPVIDGLVGSPLMYQILYHILILRLNFLLTMVRKPTSNHR